MDLHAKGRSPPRVDDLSDTGLKQARVSRHDLPVMRECGGRNEAIGRVSDGGTEEDDQPFNAFQLTPIGPMMSP